MIIRSQDKRSITSDLNLSIKIESRIMSSCLKEEFPRQAMFRIVDSKDIPLGDYSTEEKAIKVLDMIQQEYGRHFYGHRRQGMAAIKRWMILYGIWEM